MHAPLHFFSLTCAYAHIRVGLAIYAGPSTLVFSHMCHAHIRVGLAFYACPSTLVFSDFVLTHTYEMGCVCGNQDYCRSVLMVGATQAWCTNKDDLSLELGPHSMPAPLHSHSVSCAHAHIRVGLAIIACPSALVFSDWCSRTHELGWQAMQAPSRLVFSDWCSRTHTI